MEQTNRNVLNPMSITKYFKNQIPPNLSDKQVLSEKFTDPNFPPNDNSFLSKHDDGSFVDPEVGPKKEKELSIDAYEWKRISDISDNWAIFLDRIEIDDIVQGTVGNCYFLCAVAAFTGFPFIIIQKFRSLEYSPLGYYELILFLDGEWQVVVVDDYVPVFKGTSNFAFARPNGRELWVTLIEKAWAKVNGGYTNIIGGLPSDVALALTGYPAEYVYHPPNDNPAEVFTKIAENLKAKFILACSTREEKAVEAKGLVENHAYTVITAQEKPDEGIRLLKLRNPWGYKEWTGDWSDQSSKWTCELKEYFGVIDKDDGTFWMSIEDYIVNFGWTYICPVLFGVTVKSYSLEYEKYFEHPMVFNMHLPQASQVSFSVIFRHWRFNRSLRNAKRPCYLIVSRYDDNREILSVDKIITYQESMNMTKAFPAGNYVIWLYCAYDSFSDKPLKYNFNVAAHSSFKIKFMGLDKDCMLIHKICVEQFQRLESESINQCQDYFRSSVRALPLPNISFFNKSNKWLAVEARIDEISNTVLLPPYQGLSNISITIPPQQGACILGCRIAYSGYFNYFTNPYLIEYNDRLIQPPPKCENFLSLNFHEDEETNLGFSSSCYNFVEENEARTIPTFGGKDVIITSQVIEEHEKEDFIKAQGNAMDDVLILPPIYTELKLKLEKSESSFGSYIGEVYNGKYHGRGLFLWKDSGKYVGYFTNGKYDIRGTCYNEHGQIVYEGDYKNGIREGKGKYFFLSDNNHYVGELKEGNFNGHGIYYWADGSSWEGSFVDGKKHGKGICTYVSGKMQIIEYENNNILKRVDITNEEMLKLQQERECGNLISSENDGELSHLLENVLKLKEDSSSVEVKKIDYHVSESVEETAKMKKEKMLTNLTLKDPFIVEQILDIPQTDSFEEFDMITNDQGYYIGGILNCKAHGRGGWYLKSSYYLGYFKNGEPSGFMRVFSSSNKFLEYEGSLNSSFQYHGHGKCNYTNGDIYEGEYANNFRHGIGTYHWESGSSFTGPFVNDLFHGEGKLYYKGNRVSEILVYENNNVVNRHSKIREDEATPEIQAKLDELKAFNPDIFSKLMNLPIVKEESSLTWEICSLENNVFYIGQLNSAREYHGRGAFIWSTGDIATHVGYYQNNIRCGKGMYYDREGNLVYDGWLANGKRNGYGRNEWKGEIYEGEWKDDGRHGKGTFTWKNSAKWVGTFENTYFQGVGLYITTDNHTTQVIEYKNSNLVRKEQCIDHSQSEEKQKKMGIVSSLKVNHPEYMDRLLKLEPFPEDLVLDWVEKDFRDGHYYGQVNFHGQRYGRGVLEISDRKKAYIGYWRNDLKEQYGIDYQNGVLNYDGGYHMNNPAGKGIWYYSNDEKLEGDLNEAGNGYGKFTWQSGNTWTGPITSWTLNGTGNVYDSNGNFLYEKIYKYNSAA